MTTKISAGLALAAALLAGTPGAAQHTGHHPQTPVDTVRKPEVPRDTAHTHTAGRGHHVPGELAAQAPAPGGAAPAHEMLMAPLAGGWRVMGMGQIFPITTSAEPFHDDSPLGASEVYFTQPAAMVNLESPGSRVVLRGTVNFEAWTQPEGEYTLGAWGEGFIDRRHPHTLLHEAMVSFNAWNAPGGAFSVSAGKGFAPYGTDDPMSRPGVKYPTNHHLSQILERWTLNAVYLHRSGLSVEAGLFGGAEPRDPYDFSNAKSFGDSWSARVTQRLGNGFGPAAPWEASASYARVEEEHGGEKAATHLLNAALRHQRAYRFGELYALAEASRSEPDGADDGYYSLLGEARVSLGAARRHQPYLRVEYATRPEYHRQGALGSDDFFRYDHDHGHTDGSTRWLVHTAGYAYRATHFPFAAAPFVEIQHHGVRADRGNAEPGALFGGDSFWSLSTGFRIFVGGGPMRMGSYGVLDPMSAAMHAGGHGHR
jgi:hypothetical protein